MKIQDLERLTGLDRATIRFYEKENLLHPTRMENGYRDYTDEDLSTIQKIKLLRQLDLPLETIRELQQGRGELSDVLQKQIEVLQTKVSKMAQAVDVCKQLHSSGVSYSAMEPDSYLETLEKRNVASKPAEKPIFHEPTVHIPFYPIRRLIARLVDYWLVVLVLQFLFVVVLRIRPFDGIWDFLVEYGSPFLSVPLTAWCLSRISTTPGKWLMGIRTVASNGGKLSYQEALHREWNALRYGFGFGIPFYTLWRLYRSYKDYKTYDDTDWEGASWNEYARWNFPKKAAFVAFVVLHLVSVVLISADSVRPKHRGNDITIAQFAENYNFYSEILEKGGSMNADGTWYVPDTSGSVVVVVSPTKAEKINEPLRYETEGEKITRITYQNSWTDVFMLTPIDNRLTIAFITTLMSQEGFGILDLQISEDEYKKIADDETVHLTYKNVEIRWKIESQNCSNSNGTYYGNQSAEETRVTLDFEIIIH